MARAAVEVALVTDLNAEQTGTELLRGVGDFGGSERGRGGAGGRSAQVDAVEYLPTHGFDEGGYGIDVRRSDLAAGLAGAGGGPDVAVYRVAADAQDAGAES